MTATNLQNKRSATPAVLPAACRNDNSSTPAVTVKPPNSVHWRHMAGAWAWLLAGAAALLVASCKPAVPSESLKIATFNTFLRSPMMYCLASIENLPDCLLQYEDVPEANAVQTAVHILQDSYDVIVLNEVFDEDARDILVKLLSPVYPHYVKRITDADFIIEVGTDDPSIESVKFNGEDSGLMLFSRFPFAPLPDPLHRWEPDFLEATTSEVAFIRFEAYAGDDQFAAKGVGLVRIRNTTSQTIYSVAFTHLQADYGDAEYSEVRAKQFTDIQQIIKDTLASTGLNGEHIFLLGDLNVRGEGGVLDGSTASGGLNEWTTLFGTGFFSQPLTDAWAATTSRSDIGVTNFGNLDGSDDDQRLDYILATRGQVLDNRFCIQHLTRKTVGESDHLLVKAHYNREAPLCDPRHAWDQPPLDVFLNDQATPGTDRTRIQQRDGAQWFFFDLSSLVNSAGERVTVSVALRPQDEFDPATNQGVVFELYDPTDLSVPIPQYQQETTKLGEIIDVGQDVIGKIYKLPARFFIKVFSPNSNWTEDYALLVHRHECQSAEDRCILYANEQPRESAQWEPNAISGANDEKWYQIDVVDVPDSGKAQHVRIFAGPYNNNVFEAGLVDKLDPSLGLTDPPLTQDTATLKEFEGDIAGQQSMFLVVRRADPTVGETFSVGWDTNLTVLHGKFTPAGKEHGPHLWREELRCLDETNPELSSDEIHLLISVDDGDWQEIYYQEFECNDGDVFKGIEKQLGTRRYLNTVRAKLVEEDGLINPDDPGPVATIAGLNANEFSRPRQFVGWKFADGHYRMTFNLSRRSEP